MSLLYAPLLALLRIERGSSRSLKTAGGHNTHASTNPCAIAHVRDIHQSWYSHLQVFVYSVATQQDRRWTDLDFSMLETLVLSSYKHTHTHAHKYYFQLLRRDHPCCVIVMQQNQSCQLQNRTVVRNKRVWFAKKYIVSCHVISLCLLWISCTPEYKVQACCGSYRDGESVHQEQ